MTPPKTNSLWINIQFTVGGAMMLAGLSFLLYGDLDHCILDVAVGLAIAAHGRCARLERENPSADEDGE